jgi:uncharacterized protein
MSLLSKLVESCWRTMGELAPWLLVGLGLAGLLHWLIPPAMVRRRFRGYWGVAQAVALGVPLPLCSCSVIPAGLGLKRDGASDGATTGFLISTPQTGVDSVFVTASFFGWPFTLLKVLVAAVTGLVGGWLVEWTDGGKLEPGNQSTRPAGFVSRPRASLGDSAVHAIGILRSIWGWLVAGILVSALIEVCLPKEWLASLGSLGLPATMGLVLVLSLPVYVCATASVPVAAGLVAAGLPPAAGFVFLFAGPASNVATMGAIASQLGRRVLSIYLLTMVLGGMLGGWTVHLLGTGFPGRTGEHVHHLPWWNGLAAVMLLTMLAWFMVDAARRRLQRAPKTQAGLETLTIRVDGMTCGGCVERLERVLAGLPGVEGVAVQLSPGEAKLSGSIERLAAVRAIRSCGFLTPEDDPDLAPLTADAAG